MARLSDRGREFQLLGEDAQKVGEAKDDLSTERNNKKVTISRLQTSMPSIDANDWELMFMTLSYLWQIINWLCTEGEDQLRRHATIANSLRSIEAQQLDFTKFQSIAEVSLIVFIRVQYSI